MIDPTTNVITEFPLSTQDSKPFGIRPGSDGALWFTEYGTNKIGRIGAGGITEFANPDTAASVRFITPAPNGKLLFAEANTDQISAINTSGTFLGEATPPTAAPGLDFIALGPDGAVWFTEEKTNKIGQVSSNGFGGGNVAFQEYAIPTPSSVPQSLTAGPDGNLWFTEQSGNKIGKFVPPASLASPLVAAVLPGSRSVVSGNTATAFATIINGGTTAYSNCQIVPLSEVPISLTYQTTNPATNTLTGTPNTSVSLAGGASQSFLLAATANTTFTPVNVSFSFVCNNVDPAAPVVGVNTLFLSSSSVATPDIVALGATSSGDGILSITGSSGSAAFAVATANVGASGSISVSVDTGVATVPIGLTVCQTDPTSGVCLGAAASTYGPVTVNANATPTFSVFATATGTIGFAPAATRVFVRFKDTGGVTRGSTSVAVRTQ